MALYGKKLGSRHSCHLHHHHHHHHHRIFLYFLPLLLIIIKAVLLFPIVLLNIFSPPHVLFGGDAGLYLALQFESPSLSSSGLTHQRPYAGLGGQPPRRGVAVSRPQTCELISLERWLSPSEAIIEEIILQWDRFLCGTWGVQFQYIIVSPFIHSENVHENIGIR